MSSSVRYPLLALALALLGMVAAVVAGWQFAGPRAPAAAEDGHELARVTVLPFVDPDTGDFTEFNRALSAAFGRALSFVDPENLAAVGTDTTARMVATGMSPTDIARRTNAGFLLVGGHNEADHTSFIEVWAAAGDESLLRRDFELDETRPAHAPPELVESIAAVIRQATEQQH